MDRTNSVDKEIHLFKKITYFLLIAEAIYAVFYVLFVLPFATEFNISNYFVRKFDSIVIVAGMFPLTLFPVSIFFALYFYVIYVGLSIYNIYIAFIKLANVFVKKEVTQLPTILLKFIYVAIMIGRIYFTFRWMASQ